MPFVQEFLRIQRGHAAEAGRGDRLPVDLVGDVAGVGCMVGVISSASREMGSRDPDLPAIALRGLRWSVVVGGVATLLVFGSETLLFAIGHEPALASGAGSVARMLAPGALFQIVFVAGSFYLEGTARTKPGLVVMIAANVVNFLLCRLLIGGGFGLPPMGAEGAALAGTIARFLMAAGLLVWLLRLPEFDPWRGRFFGFWGPGGRIAGAEMRRIGFAGGAAYFFETVAFASLSQAAGLLGTGALTAYSILHNVESTVFMVALGLSVATSVQVGRAAGRRDAAEAIFSGLAGLAATVVVNGQLTSVEQFRNIVLRANADVLSVRDQARHSSILITDIYTPKDIQKANEYIKNYQGIL